VGRSCVVYPLVSFVLATHSYIDDIIAKMMLALSIFQLTAVTVYTVKFNDGDTRDGNQDKYISTTIMLVIIFIILISKIFQLTAVTVNAKKSNDSDAKDDEQGDEGDQALLHMLAAHPWS